jgi:hypothetical protein
MKNAGIANIYFGLSHIAINLLCFGNKVRL